ncbi:succinoglycan biosynthesis transport protein ExoP [Devosia lucknowensis]|uniref:Succinoglycan biosynthesis transport protein ExoP n=1 Tax=Devosia lucknowensis TaxID=1096929 RepID=A0A1Y6FS32_9HYPH|nr:Wzz/FepE/Etk N-terminal domain-containing protein [Devosia lucknowensis]SMQ76020.1 succinoglycan biosynthesis transport protein ExoP [Devosia lucknowensis]
MLEKTGYPEVMAPQPSDLKTIDLDQVFALVRRQALVLGLCLAVGVTLAVVYLSLAPRSYLSAAQLLIDKNLEQLTADGNAQSSATDLEAQVLNQIEVLRSSRVAKTVAEAEGLTKDQDFLNPPPSFSQRVKSLVGLGPAPQADQLEASLDQVVGMLRANVQVERMGRSSIIRVGYEAAEPELAQRIASAYATALVQDQLNAELEATSAAADWLQQRLAEIGESQRQASLAIEQYRQESGLSVGQDQTLSTQRIQSLSNQLAEAQAETARVRTLSEQLQSVIDAGAASASNSLSMLGGAETDPVQMATLRNQVATLTSRMAEIEASYGPDHPQLLTLKAEKTALDNRIYALLQNLNEQYRSQLALAQQQEAALRTNIDAEGQSAGAVSQEQVRLNELQQRSDALRALYNSYLTSYEEAVQRQSFPIPSVRVVTEALLPEDPSSPRTMVILAAAIIAGGFMGIVLGVLNELRERGFRTGAQIRQQLGLRFLGYVPRLQVEGPRSIRGLVHGALTSRIGRRWGAPFMETLKSTRLVMQPMADRGTAVIGVLSVLPDEGKTTFAISLAEMLTAIGSRVLLIDGDAGQSQTGIPTRIMPSQQGDWRKAAVADHDTGMVTLSAAAPEAGGGDLSSLAMQRVLAEARGQFDYVIIDLPPLGPVIDALSVLPYTDASVLVAEWGRTPRRLLRNMLEREPELADHIIGVVLNKVDLGALPRFTDVGGLERFAYRGEQQRIARHPEPNAAE